MNFRSKCFRENLFEIICNYCLRFWSSELYREDQVISHSNRKGKVLVTIKLGKVSEVISDVHSHCKALD